MKLLLSKLAPILWINLAMVAAVLYGILNDQVTITLSPEYFTVFKRQQFGLLLEAMGLMDAPPRLQAMAIGTAATWWFGLFLGVIVSLFGTLGRAPSLTTRGFIRVIGLVLAVAAMISVLFGAAGYVLAPRIPGFGTASIVENWPFLHGIREQRRAFAVGFWHDEAYLGGVVGTVVACVYVRRWRRRQ